MEDARLIFRAVRDSGGGSVEAVVGRQDVIDRILQRLALPLAPQELSPPDTVAVDVTGEPLHCRDPPLVVEVGMLFELPDNASPSRRQQALLSFLPKWYGLTVVDASPSSHPTLAPELLNWWHTLTVSNPVLRGVQNRFVEPQAVRVDPFRRYERPTLQGIVNEAPRDLWVFYVENQGVVTWACEAGEDPRVWARCDWPSAYAQAWSQEAETLSGFLVQAALLEALYAAPHGGAWTTMRRHDFEALASLHQIPLRVSAAPNSRLSFWTSERWIAVTTPLEDDVDVMFGALEPDVLGDIGDLVEDPYAAGLWE